MEINLFKQHVYGIRQYYYNTVKLTLASIELEVAIYFPVHLKNKKSKLALQPAPCSSHWQYKRGAHIHFHSEILIGYYIIYRLPSIQLLCVLPSLLNSRVSFFLRQCESVLSGWANAATLFCMFAVEKLRAASTPLAHRIIVINTRTQQNRQIKANTIYTI